MRSDFVAPSRHPFIHDLTLADLREYRADVNPAPLRFPNQDASVTTLARRFGEKRGHLETRIRLIAAIRAFVKKNA